jgi:type IV secretory pathway VirB4 component
MLLATQSSEDFATSPLLRTVIESCPTQFFLANPGMDIERVRELFHLNHTEAARITRLMPRQQALLKRPDLAKVVNLQVDPTSYAIYANRPIGETPDRAAPSHTAGVDVRNRPEALS